MNAIALYAHPDGTVSHPGIATITKMTGKSDKSVRRIIDWWKASGRLKVEPYQGAYHTNLYTIVLNPVTQMTEYNPVTQMTESTRSYRADNPVIWHRQPGHIERQPGHLDDRQTITKPTNPPEEDGGMEGEYLEKGEEEITPFPLRQIKDFFTKTIPVWWSQNKGEPLTPSKKEIDGLLRLAEDAEDNEVYSGPDGKLAWLNAAFNLFVNRKQGLDGLTRPLSMFLQEAPVLMEIALSQKRAEVKQEAVRAQQQDEERIRQDEERIQRDKFMAGVQERARQREQEPEPPGAEPETEPATDPPPKRCLYCGSGSLRPSAFGYDCESCGTTGATAAQQVM
jgi:hypothetical protein